MAPLTTYSSFSSSGLRPAGCAIPHTCTISRSHFTDVLDGLDTQQKHTKTQSFIIICMSDSPPQLRHSAPWKQWPSHASSSQRLRRRYTQDLGAGGPIGGTNADHVLQDNMRGHMKLQNILKSSPRHGSSAPVISLVWQKQDSLWHVSIRNSVAGLQPLSCFEVIPSG